MKDSYITSSTRLEGIGYGNNLKKERELTRRLIDSSKPQEFSEKEKSVCITLINGIIDTRKEIHTSGEPLNQTQIKRIYNSLVNKVGDSNEAIMFLLGLFSKEVSITLRGYYSFILSYGCSYISPDDSLMREKVTKELDKLYKEEEIPFIKIELSSVYVYCDSLDKAKELLKQQLDDSGGDERNEIGREITRVLDKIERRGIESIL